MKRDLSILSLAACVGLLACNPSGTCLIEDKRPDSLGDQCVLNQTKRACANLSQQHQFFAESSAQGMLRCKGDGYVDAFPKPGRDPKAIHILYRKK